MSAAVASAREWLARYLGAELDGAELEVVEREDLLFRMVAIVERHDREWLRARLADAALPASARRDVYRSLTGPLRHVVRSVFEPSAPSGSPPPGRHV